MLNFWVYFMARKELEEQPKATNLPTFLETHKCKSQTKPKQNPIQEVMFPAFFTHLI